jgi:hypothetical protein
MLDCHAVSRGDVDVGNEFSERVVKAESTLGDELERDAGCEGLRSAAHAIVALGVIRVSSSRSAQPAVTNCEERSASSMKTKAPGSPARTSRRNSRSTSRNLPPESVSSAFVPTRYGCAQRSTS